MDTEVVITYEPQKVTRVYAQPVTARAVVAGAPEEEKVLPTSTDAAARVEELMQEGLSRKDAVKQTAKELDLPKNAVYAAALSEEE